MKFLLPFIFLFAVSSQALAHEYFFGFAEMSYNEEEQAYEGTLILSTHDVEEWLIQKEVPISSLEDHIDDYSVYPLMELEIFEGFQITANGINLIFELDGYEILDNGMTQFYFHSKKVEKGNKLDITFDLMMREYPRQQNKINYLEENKSLTAVFLANHTTNSISL